MNKKEIASQETETWDSLDIISVFRFIKAAFEVSMMALSLRYQKFSKDFYTICLQAKRTNNDSKHKKEKKS